MAVSKERFIEAIQAGQYEIQKEHDCGCYISWDLGDGELVMDCDTDACWVGNVLYVDGEAISQYICGEGWSDLTEIEDVRDMLEDMDREDIIDDMWLPDGEENPDHEKKVHDALMEYLRDCGYKTAIHYPRNFSNEYDCVLVAPGAELPNDYDPSKEGWHYISADKWADMYTQEDDGANEYFIGFEIVE